MSDSKKPSVKINFIYNMAYQLFTMIVPLITTPYISRVLLPEGVGQYSYTYSIVNYFILFAQLGFGYYAQREIAKFQGNKKQQSILFFEIMIDKTLTVGISCLLYIILCLSGVFADYTILMWWWLILIIAQEFDISFLYQGNEQFSKIVFRNFFIKILSIALVFIFVKSTDDVWIYVLSVAGSNLLGALSMWAYLHRYLCKVDLSELHPLRHLGPTLRLFVPTIAAVIYSYLDKTLIGVMIPGTYTELQAVVIDGTETMVEVTKSYSDLENGFYEQSEKIVKVGTSIITALGAVMLPRNTQVYSSGNKEQLKENVYMATRVSLLIGIPIMFGLVAIAENLIPWFLGHGYETCIVYLRLFSPLVILFGLNNVFGIQYLITTNQDTAYTMSTITGAVVNIMLNILLIPKFWGYGAIVASVFAEFIIVLLMYLMIRREISICQMIKQSFNYWFSGVIMFVGLYLTQVQLIPNVLNTVLLIMEGIVIYGVSLLLLKDDFVLNFIKKYSQKFRQKLGK